MNFKVKANFSLLDGNENNSLIHAWLYILRKLTINEQQRIQIQNLIKSKNQSIHQISMKPYHHSSPQQLLSSSHKSKPISVNYDVKSQLQQLPSNFSTYLLEDYTFLNEYQLLDSSINTDTQFLAMIKSTQQLVKFIKKPFVPITCPKGLCMYKRFETMFLMFQKGLILADNMFILEEGNNTYFYYIIQPYLNQKQSTQGQQESQMPFMTLQQYLFDNRQALIGFQARKTLFIKCKNLIDNLFQTDQAYCGLNSRKIIVDDEENVFLMPYSLDFSVFNMPYERSYYPKEVLKYLQTVTTTTMNNNTMKQPIKFLQQKWDIWSFGCIVSEIFIYISPYFISTSIQSQVKRITANTSDIFNQFQDEYLNSLKKQQIQQIKSHSYCESGNDIMISRFQQIKKVDNFIRNALELEEKERVMSFEESNSNQEAKFSQRRRRKSYKTTRRHPKTIASGQGMDTGDKTMISVQKEQISPNVTERTRKTQNQHSTASTSQRLRKTQQQLDFFSELNILQKTGAICDLKQEKQKNYEFEIKFKTLTIGKGGFNKSLNEGMRNFSPRNQIQILVQFSNSQKFKFFVDIPQVNHDNDNDKISSSDGKLNKKMEIQLNKKITLSPKSFEEIESLLSQQLQITITDDHIKNNRVTVGSSSSVIFINLTALIIKEDIKYKGQHQNVRLWTKPIKGTYSSSLSDSIYCTKLKIQAKLIDVQQDINTQKQQHSLVKMPLKSDCSNKMTILKLESQVEQDNNSKELASSVVEGQQTSRFTSIKQQVHSSVSIEHNLHKEQLKNQKQPRLVQKPLKQKDLSQKIKKLLMRC